MCWLARRRCLTPWIPKRAAKYNNKPVAAPHVSMNTSKARIARPDVYKRQKWVQAVNNSRLLDFQIDLVALLGRVSFEEKIQSIMKSEDVYKRQLF